jgi:hypothetical protein
VRFCKPKAAEAHGHIKKINASPSAFGAAGKSGLKVNYNPNAGRKKAKTGIHEAISQLKT